MHRIIHANAGSEPLDIPMGLGPYSHLSGDTPDVFFEASRPAFPDGLACPSQPKDKSISSALGPIVEFSRDVIRSNNLYTCFGNTILTSSFYSGLLLHPLCAALAIFNERREHQGIAKSIDWLPRDVNLMLQSPGIYRLVLGGVFLINMFEAHAAGNHLFGIIYGFASLGNLGAGRILNHTYFERLKSNSETDPDHKVPRNKASWSDTVTNPGINWCASDLLVGVMTLNAVSIAAQVSLGVSIGLATLGLGAGIYLGKRAEKSHIPLLLNGYCNLAFAFTHLCWGNLEDAIFGIPKIALATAAWALASFIIASKQRTSC